MKIKRFTILFFFLASSVVAASEVQSAKKSYQRDYPILFGTFEFTDIEKESKDSYYESVANFFEKNPSFAINEKMKTAKGVQAMMSISQNWSKVYNYVSQKCTETANYKKCTELGDIREKILLEASSRPLMTGTSDKSASDVPKSEPADKIKKKSNHTTLIDDGAENK